MKEKFYKFMQGRYGVDSFSKFTMIVALVLIVLAMLAGATTWRSVFDFLGLLALIYTYVRIFSKDIAKRSRENQKYLAMTEKARARFNTEKNLMRQRKDYHIYTCPSCGQKIRMPRGKGKVEISCPKCHSKFVKRS